MYLDSPDALSVLLQKLELHAEVYVNGDFCGAWAVDTSGSQRLPFHLVGEGKAWLHFQGQPVKALSSGDLVLFPHDDSHAISSSTEAPDQECVNAEMVDNGDPITNMVCGFFEFKNKATIPLLNALPAAIVLQKKELDSQPIIRRLIELMLNELRQTQPGYYAVVDQLAYLLFVQILRQQIESNALNTGLLAALFDRKIGKAINCIHLNPAAKWTLEGLAEKCAMGRSSFSQHFNELVGISAMQYLTHLRMQEATQLLQKTDLALAQIAEKCGYDTDASFSKAFKKVTGISPGAMRKTIKNSLNLNMQYTDNTVIEPSN